jgi:hypothetical protein
MGVQQPLIHLIDSRVVRGYDEIIGTAVTPAYQWYDHDLSDYMWVMDVDLGGDGTRPDANTVVKSIPIADASHGVHKAGPSTKVRLRRMELKRTYEIVGLASIVNGQAHVIEVTYAGSGGGYTQGATTTYGSSYTLLNYDDLGDPASNGGHTYGKLPYGTFGKYDAQGNLQYVLATP